MLVEDHIHGTLACCTCILQVKSHHCVAVHSQWCSKRCILLVFRIHLNLIISWEAIHEGHSLKTAHIINHDICDRERKLIFGTSSVQIVEVNTNLNLSLLFREENNVGNPIRMLLLPDEIGVYELFDFWFNCFHNLWTESLLLLLDGLCIRIDVEAMHSHLRIKLRHILVAPSENIYILSHETY